MIRTEWIPKKISPIDEVRYQHTNSDHFIYFFAEEAVPGKMRGNVDGDSFEVLFKEVNP